MKFKELSNTWLSNQKQYVKDSTYYMYKLCLDTKLIPYFGEKEIEGINASSFNEYINIQKEIISNSTINQHILIFNMIIKNHLDLKIRKIKDDSVHYEIFTNSEIELIIQYCIHSKTLYDKGTLIAIYTGIRIGELSALTNKDLANNKVTINKTLQRTYCSVLKTKVIISEPKSKKANRIVPMNKILVDNIDVKYDDKYFITNLFKPSEPKHIRNAYKLMLNNLGIKYRPFHYLRHTFATNLINNGNDIKTISELLGHASVATTLDIYMHSNNKIKEECIGGLYK